MATFFEEIKRYVAFSPRDEACLRGLLPIAEPSFTAIAERFYEHILSDPKAGLAITGGDEQVERLKLTLVDWMRSGLQGPHDEAFFERRARIGRVHVAIKLPQHFMFTAMNVMRIDFRDIVERHFANDEALRRDTSNAIDRLFDLELAIMLQTYNEDSAARLRRRERLATIGQLAASIGHELRNPLGVISSSAYLLRKRSGDDPKVLRHLDRIAGQIDNCNGIVTNLLDLARDHAPKWEVLDFSELVAESLDGVTIPESINVASSLDIGHDARGDHVLLRQAIVNLLRNAVQALERTQGHIELRLTAREGMVTVTVRDTGPGFDTALLPMVFEPLVTNKSKGTGLGLALVKSTVERMGGTVRASNHAAGGAEVTMQFPADPPSAA